MQVLCDSLMYVTLTGEWSFIQYLSYFSCMHVVVASVLTWKHSCPPDRLLKSPTLCSIVAAALRIVFDLIHTNLIGAKKGPLRAKR